MSINKSKARKLAEFLRNLTDDAKINTDAVDQEKVIDSRASLEASPNDTESLVTPAAVTSYVGNKLGEYVHETHDINLTFTGDVTGSGTITDMSHTSIGLTLDAETLPDQAGYDGYFLTTDGSVASWAEVDFSETNTSLSIAGNVLTYTDETGTDTTIDLSLYLDDTNLARLTSGSIDGNGLATFTRDDATTFTVDFSSLFDDTNLSRIDEASFNISDGVLTLTRDDDSTAATVDLDGRYVLGSGTYNNTNWDTAYGWGDHATAGYATETYVNNAVSSSNYISAYNEYPSVINTGTTPTTLKNNMGGGGVRVDFMDDTTFGSYAHVLTFSGYNGYNMYQLAGKYQGTSGANGLYFRNEANHQLNTWTAWNKLWDDDDFSTTDVSNWDTAYGWGNHATQGYLTSLPSHNHDDRYYTEGEINTFINRGYISNHSATNLAVGWYTIATNTGSRASARFGIWDTNSGDHQSVTFYAAHHFGTDSSNTLTVLDNSYYSGNPFRYIRIKDSGTYDGAALQIYIDDSSNAVNAAILGDNFQSSGWVLCDWVPDATAPPGVSNYSNFGERAAVDLNEIAQGGFATTGEIRSEGNLHVKGNVLLGGSPTTTNQGRMIDFTGFDKEGTTDYSDRAYIQHTTNTAGHSGSVLVISSQNDSNDGIGFATHASSQIKHNGHTMWDAGNDGSGSGLDADLLDGVQGSQFLRSDASDSASQRISFSANDTNNWDTIATSAGGRGCLEVYNSGSGNDAFMTFHVGGDFACYFGLDGGINDLAVGGWSMGSSSYRIWHAANDGSGSGLDADTVDGIQGSSLLRSDANDNLTSAIIVPTGNRNQGIFGTYDSYKTQHIWSMGTAYRNAANGSSFGNLYGAAYTYSNRVYTAKGVMANGHQMVWCQNGTPTAAMGNHLWTSGNTYAAGFIYNSDKAFKENIEPLENSLDTILKLEGVKYTLKESGKSSIGFIAQDVEKVIPEFVEGDEGNKGVNYGQMVAVLVEAMKEQQKQIQELRAKVEELKNESK